MPLKSRAGGHKKVARGAKKVAQGKKKIRAQPLYLRSFLLQMQRHTKNKQLLEEQLPSERV